MLATWALSLSLLANPSYDLRSYPPYLPAVPEPSQVLGFELGTRHTFYSEQDRVLERIAAAEPARIRRMDYGKSWQGRALRVYAVSSPENMRRLEDIRKLNEKLAQGVSAEERARIQREMPAIAWINQVIHGDETAAFESAMQLVYTLTASNHPDVERIRERLIVIVNPVYNPDGHERYVHAYSSFPISLPEDGTIDQAVPSAFGGRSNHYRFDMNRDRIALSQAETRQEVALFLQWNPHVYVDQHGEVETYFFPPVQQSVNVNVDRERYNRWAEVFGRASARAFDQQGWTYSIRDAFDFYNPCYLDTFVTLSGSIGMTHETDGGSVLATKREDGTLLTLRTGLEKHFVAAMAVLKSAADKRSELIESFGDFKARAASGQLAGKFQRVVLTDSDPRRLNRLAQQLDRAGVRSFFAARSWTQTDAHNYWTGGRGEVKFPQGSLVVDLAQPQGALAKSLLEPMSDFEPEFIARQKRLAANEKANRPDPELDGYEFYDYTGWALPYAHNLKAWWCESAPKVPTQAVPKPVASMAPESTVGYALRYTDQEDILFVARQLSKGVRVSQSQREMLLDGQTFAPGTFLFLAARNERGFDEDLRKAAADASIGLVPLKTSWPDVGRFGPGSSPVAQLASPKIGVVMGSGSNLAGGAFWYLMEQEFKLPFVPLSTFALNGRLESYTTLVMPEGVRPSQLERLQSWVEQGGNLVVLGSPEWAIGEKAWVDLETARSEPELPGSVFRAELDPYSFLSYGYPRDGDKMIEVAVPLDGSRFHLGDKPRSAVQLPAGEQVNKLLTGWKWDNTEKDLRGVVFAHEFRLGRGRVTLFFQDPSSRAQWPGLWKMMLNAMVLGPSAR